MKNWTVKLLLAGLLLIAGVSGAAWRTAVAAEQRAAVAEARYEHILRRLDRIEDKLDDLRGTR